MDSTSQFDTKIKVKDIVCEVINNVIKKMLKAAQNGAEFISVFCYHHPSCHDNEEATRCILYPDTFLSKP
jgi:hypothetical protein